MNRSLTKKTFSNVIIWGMHNKGYLIIIAIQNVSFTIRRRQSLDLAMLKERKKERSVIKFKKKRKSLGNMMHMD